MPDQTGRPSARLLRRNQRLLLLSLLLLLTTPGCGKVKRAIFGETPAEKAERLHQVAIDADLLDHVAQYSNAAGTVLEIKELAVTLGKIQVAVSILEGSATLQDLVADVVTGAFVGLLLESTGVIEAIEALIRYTNQMANLHGHLDEAFAHAIATPDEQSLRHLAQRLRGAHELLEPTAAVVAVVADWLTRFMAEWRHVNDKLELCSTFSLGLKAKACWVVEACSDPLEELAHDHIEERVVALHEQLQGDLAVLTELTDELRDDS